MVAIGMLFVYKIGAIRVTPKFTRVLTGATIGVFGLMIVNGLAYLFHPGGLGLRTGGTTAIIFSLICIVIASMCLVQDFDLVERGIRNGADQKFAWYCAFGLTVTLVWLYLEILRLLPTCATDCAGLGLEPVAHAGLGDQVARTARLGLQLAAQLRDVDAQVARVGVVRARRAARSAARVR